MQRATPGSPAKLALMLVALLVALPAFRAPAEPASDPAGFYRITCLGNSDTIVSIPFSRPAAANVIVESVADNVVTVKGDPGWTEDQFVYAAGSQTNTYYVRFLSGAKEGSYLPVTANGEDTLTLSLGGDDLSSVADGDQAAVIPYWTLGTAFPDGRGIIASTTTINNTGRKTEILVPDFNGIGINLSANQLYYYYKPNSETEGVWRKPASTDSMNDEILLPDVYFIVRHKNSPVGTVFTASGSVPVSKLAFPLMVQQSPAEQDNVIALARPATLTLDASGLIDSGAFLVRTSLNSPYDRLIVFDNTVQAMNKSASAVYYYQNGGWRKVNASGDFGGEPVFTPGNGIIIRKAGAAEGGSSVWVNPAPY